MYPATSTRTPRKRLIIDIALALPALILISMAASALLFPFQLSPFTFDIYAVGLEVPIEGCLEDGVSMLRGITNQPANGFLIELRWLHLVKLEQYDKLVAKSASLEAGVVDYKPLLIRVWGFEHANPKDPVAYSDLSHALPPCLDIMTSGKVG
jgi:hypothetical protein